MRVALYDKWFGEDEDEIRAETEETIRRLDTLKVLVRSEAYKMDIVAWLDKAIDTNTPKPDTEGGMLHQIGISTGLRLVREHLSALEHQARISDV